MPSRDALRVWLVPAQVHNLARRTLAAAYRDLSALVNILEHHYGGMIPPEHVPASGRSSALLGAYHQLPGGCFPLLDSSISLGVEGCGIQLVMRCALAMPVCADAAVTAS